MSIEHKVHLLIVAAGSGSRFGASLPKQFHELGGRPILMHTIENFRNYITSDNITVVLSADMVDYWTELCHKHSFEAVRIVIGGKTRWESVRNGISSLDFLDESDYVLVHDGARPFTKQNITSKILNCLENGADGAIPVIPVTDSLRQVGMDGSMPVDREEYRCVQTPQGFPLGKLRRAFEMPYHPSFTDEATLMEQAGFINIDLVEGNQENIKITRPIDIKIAEFLLHNDS